MYDPFAGGLKKLIGEFYVTGGFLRKELAGMPNDDCDIDVISVMHEPMAAALRIQMPSQIRQGAFGSTAVRFEDRTYNFMPMQGSIYGTLDTFDFVCCQVARTDGATYGVLSRGHAINHIRDRVLKPTPYLLHADKKLAKRSWARLGKLLNEGYSIAPDDLKAMCESWTRLMFPNGGDSDNEDAAVEF